MLLLEPSNRYILRWSYCINTQTGIKGNEYDSKVWNETIHVFIIRTLSRFLPLLTQSSGHVLTMWLAHKQLVSSTYYFHNFILEASYDYFRFVGFTYRAFRMSNRVLMDFPMTSNDRYSPLYCCGNFISRHVPFSLDVKLSTVASIHT